MVVALVFNEQSHELLKAPSSFGALKKEVKKYFKVEGMYSIFVCNGFGARVPVKSNQTYLRAVNVLKTTDFEIMVVEESKEDEEDEIILKRPVKAKKVVKNEDEEMGDAEDEGQEKEVCVICCLRMREPMSAKCKHVFCKSCWEKTLKNFLECPMCKARVRFNQLEAVYQD